MLALAVAVACFACRPHGGRVAPGAVREVLSLDGLTVSQFSGEVLALRLRAEHLRVVPRRFGPFRVGTLREAVLSRVRCEVFQPMSAGHDLENPPAPSTMRGERVGVSGVTALLGGTGARHLTAVFFYDLDCAILRGGTPVARFSAARADLAAGRDALVLRDFRLDRLPARVTVTAGAAEWDPKANEFIVRGAYELRNRGELRRGRGIRVHP